MMWCPICRIITALDNKLASGFVTHILEATDKTIDYIDQGWILDLHKRLTKSEHPCGLNSPGSHPYNV